MSLTAEDDLTLLALDAEAQFDAGATRDVREYAAAAAPEAREPELIPLGNFYLVRLLPAPDMTESGIALPENTVGDAFDGVILAHGPGRIDAHGHRYPLQAAVGDRVMMRPWDFWPMRETTDADGRPVKLGFVRDEALVALKRFGVEADGDDLWGPLEPAGDYVLIAPDPVESVKMSAGGIAIATTILGGGDLRERQRGEELHRELLALERTAAWREAPDEYYRHRIVWDFLSALSAWELDALRQTVKRGGDTGWKGLRKMALREQPTSGRVIVPGPGDVRSDRTGAWRISSAAIRPEHVGHDPDEDRFSTVSLAPGDRVHWNRSFKGVFLTDEEGTVLAIPAKYLDAFEAEV